MAVSDQPQQIGALLGRRLVARLLGMAGGADRLETRDPGPVGAGLFDFAGLQATGAPVEDGDIAFDVSPEFEAVPAARPEGEASVVELVRRKPA